MTCSTAIRKSNCSRNRNKNVFFSSMNCIYTRINNVLSCIDLIAYRILFFFSPLFDEWSVKRALCAVKQKRQRENEKESEIKWQICVRNENHPIMKWSSRKTAIISSPKLQPNAYMQTRRENNKIIGVR